MSFQGIFSNYSEVRKVSAKILESIRTIDEKIDSCFKNYIEYPIHGFPYLESVILLMRKFHIKDKTPLPRIFLTTYDLFMMGLFELGILRGIRYSGSRSFTARNILEIEKLQLERSGSEISKTFPGTLISYGKILEVKSNTWDMFLSAISYLNMLKPFSAFYKLERGFASCILPSPMSFLTLSPNYYLIPTPLLLILDYTNTKEYSGIVLGEKIDCIATQAFTIGCRINNKDDIEFRYFGPFTAIIPKIPYLTDQKLYDQYLRDQMPVVTYTNSIIEVRDDLVLNSRRKRASGRIVVFNELPFMPEFIAASIIGHVKSLSIGEYIKLDIGLCIDIDETLLNNLKGHLYKFLRKISSKFGFNSTDFYRKSLGNVLLDKSLTNVLKRKRSILRIYAPAIVSFSINKNEDPEFICKVLHKLAHGEKYIEERHIPTDTKVKDILKIKNHLSTWNFLIHEQKRFLQGHELYMLI
ncbi:MAG: hypothetical protein ACTSXX_12370 [Candidatus Baldrarchaeia archaeon]